MNTDPCPRRLALAASFAALLLAASPPAGLGAIKTYVGADNGLWTTAANWNPGGSPSTIDDVFLGSQSAPTTDLHVIYNETGTLPLTSVTLNSSGLNGFMIVNQTAPSSELNVVTLNIGTTVIKNTWNQSAGFVGASTLNVGVNASSGSGNSYNLSGTGQLNGNMNIGVSGAGVFNQTGGTHNIFGGSSALGVNVGSSGSYNLSAGALNAGGAGVQVGQAGTGTFTQSGGSSSIGFLNVGTLAGTGTYSMSGGTLDTGLGGIVVGGGAGAATFNLSGGTATAPDRNGAPGVTMQIGGTFNLQAGGTLNGNIQFNNGGIISLQGGSFTTPPEVTQTGSGDFRLNGHNITLASLSGNFGAVRNLNSANVTLTLAQTGNTTYGGTIENAGSGSLSLVKSGAATQTLSGPNTYSGATIVITGTLAAGSNGGFSPASAFLVNGGKLDAGGFDVTVASLGGLGGTVAVGSGSLTAGGSGFSSIYNGALTGAGTFNKVGAGQLTLTGGGSFSGDMDVQGGSLRNTASNGIPTAAAVGLSGLGTALNVAANQTLAALSGASLTTVNFLGNSVLTVGANNLDTTFAGGFSGGGALVKVGAGTFTLGIGQGDTASGNTAASLAFNVLGGTLALNKADGTNAVAGPLNLFNGAAVVLRNHNQIADTSVVTLNGGTFNLSGRSETIGGLLGANGTVNVSGALTVLQSVNGTYGGALLGDAAFIKGGVADLTLNGAGNFGGKFTVNAGRLILQGAVNTLGATANSGGTLRFNNAEVNLNNSFLRANSGGAVEYLNTSVSNGFLRGPGTHTILGGGGPTSFNGVSTFNSTVLTQNGTAFFNNFSNGGTLHNNATAQFDGVVNAASGVVNVNNTVTATDFSSTGIINVPAGGTLKNVGSNLVLGGGSRTYVGAPAAPGGTLAMFAGATVELNGGLLVNNGTVTGTTNVNFGSLAKGAGTFGTVNVNDGGRFSPGNSPGSATVAGLTLGAGGRYDFELSDAAGTPGNGIDFVHDLGQLDLAAGTTANSRFTVGLFTLNGAGQAGLAINFDPSQSYTFVLVQADGGITGYHADEFTVDATAFQNALAGGSFAVLQQGNDLVLAFSPGVVPEPGSLALSALGGLALLLGARRFARPTRLAAARSSRPDRPR